MNKVNLTGRITKDPEIRYTSNGMATLTFTIAVDRNVRDAQGNRQADFISCVAWGQQADFMFRYVKKGNMLAVCGRIQTRNYQGQDNQIHYVTEVVVESVENLTPRDPNAAPQLEKSAAVPQPQQFQQANTYAGYNNPTYGVPKQNPTYQEAQPVQPKSFNVDVDDEDLPF